MTGKPSTSSAGPEKHAQACSATTKAGKPCKAAPLKDRDVCLAHADEETRTSTNFQQGPRPGRPRSPRVIDVLRERIEADIDRWLKPLEDGLTAERGLVVGDGPAARIEYVEDHATRIKAFREGMDRAFGRPTQTHDITTRVEESEVDREISELLGQMDSADPDLTEVGQANGKGH